MSIVLPDALVTGRLRLRRPTAADARAVFAGYAQDHAVCRFMIWTPHASLAATEAFVASCIEAWQGDARRPYVLTTRDDEAAIGMIEARLLGTTIDVGYVLARACWGRGLMPEALHALTQAALARADYLRVQATCDVDNIASRRTLEKAGFVHEGRLARHSVHPNLSAEPRDCDLYALAKPAAAGAP